MKNQTTLGRLVIDAVIASRAIESAHQTENGGCVIVWRANSEEQIEAVIDQHKEAFVRPIKELVLAELRNAIFKIDRYSQAGEYMITDAGGMHIELADLLALLDQLEEQE